MFISIYVNLILSEFWFPVSLLFSLLRGISVNWGNELCFILWYNLLNTSAGRTSQMETIVWLRIYDVEFLFRWLLYSRQRRREVNEVEVSQNRGWAPYGFTSDNGIDCVAARVCVWDSLFTINWLPHNMSGNKFKLKQKYLRVLFLLLCFSYFIKVSVSLYSINTCISIRLKYYRSAIKAFITLHHQHKKHFWKKPHMSYWYLKDTVLNLFVVFPYVLWVK